MLLEDQFMSVLQESSIKQEMSLPQCATQANQLKFSAWHEIAKIRRKCILLLIGYQAAKHQKAFK